MVSFGVLGTSTAVVLAALLFSRSRFNPTPYPDRLAVIKEEDTRIDNHLYDDVSWWDEEEIVYTLRKTNVIRCPFFHRHLSKGGKIPSKGRYLDVGCGGGLLTEDMASTYGYNITGIDISEASLRQAREHGRHIPNLHYQVGSAYDIPFPDDSFDGVIISEVLDHLMDLRKAIQEIYRVLKPGGVVVFDTISRNFKSYLLVWLIAQEILQVMYNDTHDWRLFITPEEMERLLSETGFVVGSPKEEWIGMDYEDIPFRLARYILGGMKQKHQVFEGNPVELPGDLSMIYGGVARKPQDSY
ncbi:3-demethylubiquinone-9 3-methyltransferase, putative [Perkinsus marinus ATCC 50983]|uniref:3-demethylubiquinone-9 3-methyltransferase, putative n=1 Tax=Perkinsus marinus (strain ATCC 50983 / TXsc) TaxID=423536 RepID=C5LW52_PERM5|nr:3-demethylubiquinone-9 3-methyltransferase, putative [Perkinsus marinus ATCC 50983]EEQ99041.1 3-demethylubiquinone-9 3-methyltransferase, putative [Perkinsus marinus ATCC 50983]|eukprot:XP_002766324.1 3-demethylubiquinone-9 3-methyltransferase, putative [Perkinsus marinus ATCC 50983]